MKIGLRLLLFGFFISVRLLSQDNDGPVRVEFEARAEVFHLVPCGEMGILMFYESVKQTDQNNKAWVCLFYDKSMKPQWSREIPVIKDLSYIDFYLTGNVVYLAFQNLTKTRADEYNFQLVKINLSSTEFKAQGIFIPEKADLANFEVSGNTFVGGFNYVKDEAIIIIKNLENEEEKVVKFAENPSFIKDLRIDPARQQVLVAINIYQERKQSALYLNHYDFGGNLQNSVLVSPARESEKLMNARLNFTSPTEIFILGSFNNLNGRLSKTDESSQGEESEGFYIAKIENGEQKFIRLHRLVDFKNITQILNNEQLAQVSSLTKKNKKKGNETNLNYEFLMHDLVKNGDDFVMLAEAYYPEYHQVSTMSYDFYGRPMPYYYTVFDGYRYFNAFVAGFNQQGDLLWSNGIKIWDVRSFLLQKKVEVYFDDEDAVLFYNHDGKIVSKAINGNEEIGDEEHTKIAMQFPGDVQMEASQGMIRHWYGNFFVAYGYQTLKNSALGGGSKRSVFYFNKVIFN